MRVKFKNVKTYVDDNGYLRFSDSGKLVHRWVAERKYGCKIPKHYVVHHVDGNKLNNNPDNLVVMHWSAHAELHGKPGLKEYNKTTVKGCLIITIIIVSIMIIIYVIMLFSHNL